MRNYIQNKLNTIKNNNSYGVFIEVGAGLPVYNELCQYPNTASKIAYYAESPNSWEYNTETYQHDPLVRAVSAHVCLRFMSVHYMEIMTKEVKSSSNVNFILANTVQIANTSDVVSHGWFGYMNLEKAITRFYHYTISNHGSRKTQLDIISKIGLDIIASQGDSSLLDNGYIDNILDIDFNILHEEVLTSFIHGKLNKYHTHNTTAIFTKNKKIERVNDYFRKTNDIIVFKGSFNPVHKDHLKLMDNCLEKIDATPLFAISIDNRDPNKKIDVKNLIKRIELLHSFGYDVIVDTFGFYHNSYVTLTQNQDFKNRKLYYILGADIIKRFLQDEYVYTKPTKASINAFNLKWNSCEFLWFSRSDIKVTVDQRLEHITHVEKEATHTSSTMLREFIQNKDFEKLNEFGYTDKLYHTFLD